MKNEGFKLLKYRVITTKNEGTVGSQRDYFRPTGATSFAHLQIASSCQLVAGANTTGDDQKIQVQIQVLCILLLSREGGSFQDGLGSGLLNLWLNISLLLSRLVLDGRCQGGIPIS